MKKTKYLKFFPNPFLQDLVENRCLPIVGAGFSKNADIPIGKRMLDWSELGQEFAKDIIDYEYTNPIDSISAYSHTYSRTNLVEKLTNLLLIDSVDKVKAGNTHKAFCQLPFDIVCTTNFEFLLEQGSRTYRPILNEDQLAICSQKDVTTLLKLHGDVHHPNRLVVTEDDYDGFIGRNPMLVTYLANLLITRTAFFIGYSLEDTDFRQILALVKDRLGSLRRPAYVLKVDCPSIERDKFERRGVKVINLEGKANDYPKILEEVFIELKDYWDQGTIKNTIASEDATRAEIVLPEDSNNRLCFFSMPAKLLPFYKEHIFPIITKLGLVPTSADENISIGDNLLAKISAFINKAEFIVVDIKTQNTIFELGLALSQNKPRSNILVITDNATPIPIDIQGFGFLTRPENPFEDTTFFQGQIEAWFRDKIQDLKQIYDNEPQRLLSEKEYKAAIISAMTLLEAGIRQRIENHPNYISNKGKSLNYLFDLALDNGIIAPNEENNIRQWMKIRNELVHTQKSATAKEAKKIVNEVNRIIIINQL